MGLMFSSFPWLAASLLPPCVVWLRMLTLLRSGRHFEVKKKKKPLSLHTVLVPLGEKSGEPCCVFSGCRIKS